MKNSVLISIVLLFNASLYSQSLLKNGGHEIFIKAPAVPDPSDMCFRELYFVGDVPPPLNPLNPDGIASACASPDHMCYTPRTGQAHGGFFFSPKVENPEYEMCFPMEAGFKYRVSAYFLLRDVSDLAVDQIGFWLTDWGYKSPGSKITEKPSYRSPVNEFYIDKNNYHQVGFTYTAKGNETALVLGNFVGPDNPNGSNTVVVGGGVGGNIAYYYVDDIAINPVPELEPQYTGCPNQLFQIIPKNNKICSGNQQVKWYFPLSSGVIISEGDTLQYPFAQEGILAAVIGPDTLYTQIKFGSSVQNPLPDTAYLCQGGSLTLNADLMKPGLQYLWSDGSTGTSLNVSSPGNYTVSVTDEACLSVFETLVIGVESPDWHLEKDSFLLCGSTPIVINFNLPPNYKVVSSDGQSGTTLSFNQAGTYALKLSPSCSLTDVDSLYILNEQLPEKAVLLPDAFTPNGDGKNDLFRAWFEQTPQNYQISVLDRWGKEVFSSTDPAEGWDGNFIGKAAASDVFVYKLRCDVMTCSELKEVIKIGDVTLVR